MTEEKKRPLVIDAFTFFNELDILEFRLKVLLHLVDVFVIVEASHTFSGNPKPFYFEEQEKLDRFNFAKEKIRYVKIILSDDDLEIAKKDSWHIEKIQRNSIIAATASFDNDDFLMMGDVDEIPSRDAVTVFPEHVTSFPLVCQQKFFYYNLSNLRNEVWNGTVICTLGIARKWGTQELRDKRHTMTPISFGGWHISYFGGKEAIKHKVESFSHQEYNTVEFKDDTHLEECLINGKDLFKRKVGSYKVGRGFFPSYFTINVSVDEWWGK